MASELVYRLQVARDVEFMDIVFYDTVEFVTSATFQYLDNATKYYWRTKGVNAVTGAESPWSSHCVFTTVGVDIIMEHNTSYIDFLSINNSNALIRKCPVIGLNVQNLLGRMVPAGGDCTYLGLSLSALSGREVI